jgi:hypothetical protein
VVSLRIPRDVFAKRRYIEFAFNIPESTGESDQLKDALTEAEPQRSIPDRTRSPSDGNPEHDEEEDDLEPEIANSLALKIASSNETATATVPKKRLLDLLIELRNQIWTHVATSKPYAKFGLCCMREENSRLGSCMTAEGDPDTDKMCFEMLGNSRSILMVTKQIRADVKALQLQFLDPCFYFHHHRCVQDFMKLLDPKKRKYINVISIGDSWLDPRLQDYEEQYKSDEQFLAGYVRTSCKCEVGDSWKSESRDYGKEIGREVSLWRGKGWRKVGGMSAGTATEPIEM